MKLIEFGELSPRQRAELEGDETDPFEVGNVRLQFRAKKRHVGLLDEDGALVASTGLVMADAQVGEEQFPVAGLGGVIVRASVRGQGLAREIVEAALDAARASEAKFALLFCRPDRAGLYRRLGFTHVPGEVLVQQPDGYEVIPLETMWKPLHDGADWPTGHLVLHSLPF